MPVIVEHLDGNPRIFRLSLCAEAAIVLHRHFGLPLRLLSFKKPDPDGDPDELFSEPCHAVVLVDESRGIWADAYGVFEGFDVIEYPPGAIGDPVFDVVSGEDEVNSTFSSEPINEAYLQRAREFLEYGGWINRIGDELRKLRPSMRMI